MPVRIPPRLAGSSFAHVLGAFFVMGSWGFFANSAHGAEAAITAGIVQGVLSACITLTLKTFVERLAPRFSGRAALWGPPALAALIAGALLTMLHRLSGTPEVLYTVALPLSAATGYAAIYNYTLWRSRKAE